MWADADLTELHQVWAEGLGSYGAEDIKRALETMVTAYQDYPPTLPQFAGMCRDARATRLQTTRALEYKGERQPMPEAIRAQLRTFLAKHQ
jgi:cob(I)alamin adenosyltransferase